MNDPTIRLSRQGSGMLAGGWQFLYVISASLRQMFNLSDA